MKDKLRELVERWRATAKRLPDGDYAVAHEVCAVELLAILDAEGDGGAVAWMLDSDGYKTYWPSAEIAAHGQDNLRLLGHASTVTPLYTHPARSGVVSDEDARDAARYRHIRIHGADLIEEDRGNGPMFPYGDALDAAVCAAMQESQS